ncbi:hypothetical protein E8E13_011235 [Curvularia kusanoi]|uniref:F-box domain-containing protein n=1 Tax=Curvularia kusanoi TaxID=90978 RepID=A0A9P4TNU0_CURKU|nr:hypothetical protein E8E13_011235 [Curvularia kusanoi]
MPVVKKRRLQDDCYNQTNLKRDKRDHAESRKSHIDHLPEELMVLILDCLDEGSPRSRIDQPDRMRHLKAFHSLCLTCRKLNRLAKPYLYSTIMNEIRYDARERLEFLSIHASIDRLVLDDKVADGIKRISWVHITYGGSTYYRNALSAVKLKFFQKLGTLGIPELAGELRKSFDADGSKDHLAALLVLTRNLEYLEVLTVYVAYGHSPDLTWLDLLQLSTCAPGLISHFQHLHHVRLGMDGLKIIQIGPLLRLVSLRTLSIQGADQYEEELSVDLDQIFGKQCSAIETLIMENSRIESDTIASILAAIKRLKVLKLEFSSLSRTLNDEWLFDPVPQIPPDCWTTLSEALLAHKDSLEQLYIINRQWHALEDDIDHPDNLRGRGALIGMSNLHKLRYLDTGLSPFCDPSEGNLSEAVDFSDMLPANLEHLVISVEGLPEPFDLRNSSIQKTLLELARVCGSKAHSLKGIVVWLPHDHDELCALDFEACKAAFERLNINLIVMCCYDFEWLMYPFNKEIVSERSSGFIGRPAPDMVRVGEWRPPWRFQGACKAYHHPYEWSIIDSRRK